MVAVGLDASDHARRWEDAQSIPVKVPQAFQEAVALALRVEEVQALIKGLATEVYLSPAHLAQVSPGWDRPGDLGPDVGVRLDGSLGLAEPSDRKRALQVLADALRASRDLLERLEAFQRRKQRESLDDELPRRPLADPLDRRTRRGGFEL